VAPLTPSRDSLLSYLRLRLRASLSLAAETAERDPKAHSPGHDLDEAKAAQYLAFASLLARRISEAKLVRKP
jgi:hypothetical protein